MKSLLKLCHLLQPGDHVIAVNGRNVAKVNHDEVVKLIGNSTGLLKLQIAENYCSSSDDEEWSQNLSDNEEYMIPPPALPALPATVASRYVYGVKEYQNESLSNI